MKFKATACIEAPKEKTWEYLSDVSNINLWVDSIVESSCEGTQARGIGMVRVCRLFGDKVSKEKFIAWDEGNSYTYLAVQLPEPIMKQAKNTWSVTSVNGKTLLTSEPDIVFKGGVFGKLLGLFLRPIIQKEMTQVLALFKYLVENGRPYERELSDLPKAPLTC